MAELKRIEIRWRDLDAFGHVNQAVYVTFAEEVLDDFFRTRLGLAPGTVWDYVATRTTLEYHAELRSADGPVTGRVTDVQVGTSSITARIELARADETVAATVETVVVAIDRDTWRPRPVTDADRQALAPD